MATRAGGGNVYSTTNTWPKTVTMAAVQAGDLIVVFAATTGQTAAPTITDDNSSGTYTLVTTALKNTSADAMHLFVRDSLCASTASTIVSMSSSGTTGGGMTTHIIRSVTRSGTSAILQSAKQENQAAATPAPTFGSAPLTSNVCLTACNNATNPAGTTKPAAFTLRNNLGYNTPAAGITDSSVDSGFTTAAVTYGGASPSAFCSIAVEIDTSAAPAGGDPFPFVGGGYYPVEG